MFVRKVTDNMYKTRVSRAHTKADSLRTTLPKHVCKELNIKQNDVLDWSIEIRQGKKTLTVRIMK